MKAVPVYWGPWHRMVAVKHALCADGRRRYARITGEPDTYFSVPAAVKVGGKSVSGFIAQVEGEDDLEFCAYTYGKNGALLQRQKSPA